jgi:uncharacterized membrane protein YfcA
VPIAVLPAALAIGSGVLVGLVLGLVGGGGSILAVPLLVYLVGVSSPHVAIGTAAIVVALNAAVSLGAHARLGSVKWRCPLVFAPAGVVGSLIGAALGKAIDGQRLLALFGLIMIAVGLSMLRPPNTPANEAVRLTRESVGHLLPRLIGMGFVVGALAGFFGIGGGFLIVPGLMLATGMALPNAVGTSLVAITAFGLATAASYATSGLIDWSLAALVIGGGVVGSIAGSRLNASLASDRHVLNRVFGVGIVAVGVTIVARGLPYLLGAVTH